MPYITYDPENGRYFHVSLSWPSDLDAFGDSSPANAQAEALTAALAITSRLPAAGGPPTPWPFVRRRR